MFDLPGATPSHLVLAVGKYPLAYLNDANNLGGVADALVTMPAGSTLVFGAHAVYSTATATYLVYRGHGPCATGEGTTDVATLVLVPGAPPQMALSWCATASGGGAPIVTTTDGQSDAIVWVVGAEGNDLLQGFDGDTGATIFDGGSSPIPARRFNAPIAAKGRIFVAADDMVVAFTP